MSHDGAVSRPASLMRAVAPESISSNCQLFLGDLTKGGLAAAF